MTPYSEGDLAVGLLVAGVLVALTWALARRSPDRKVIVAGMAARLLVSFLYGMIVLFYYGGPDVEGGDSQGYHTNSIRYANLLRTDLETGSSDYLTRDLFCLPGSAAVYRVMSFSGLVHVLTFDSFLGSSFVFAGLGYLGILLMYQVFVSTYPARSLRRWWQVGLLFLPTSMVWSSGLLKDPLGMLGLGLAVHGTWCFLRGRPLRAAVLVGLGLYTLYLFRAHVIPVFLAASIPWVCLGGADPRAAGPAAAVRARMVGVARLALLGGALVAAWFLASRESAYDAGVALQQIRRQNEAWAGRSRDESLTVDGSFVGLLLHWPEAVVYTLFRPFLWEGLSPLRLFAALENTALLLLTLRALFLVVSRPPLRARLPRAPLFLPSLVFVLVFCLMVGLTTLNLGSVSRYRLPLLPFFVALIVIVEALARAPAAAGEGPAAGRRTVLPRPAYSGDLTCRPR